jgi:hypothetical protein
MHIPVILRIGGRALHLIITMNHPQGNLVLIELDGEAATCEGACDDGAENGTARSGVEVTEVSADVDADMVMEFAAETEEII